MGEPHSQYYFTAAVLSFSEIVHLICAVERSGGRARASLRTARGVHTTLYKREAVRTLRCTHGRWCAHNAAHTAGGAHTTLHTWQAVRTQRCTQDRLWAQDNDMHWTMVLPELMHRARSCIRTGELQVLLTAATTASPGLKIV